MQFEWDTAKNQPDIQKHGIDFQDACSLFDASVLEWEQAGALIEHGETRLNALGLIRGYEVFAVL